MNKVLLGIALVSSGACIFGASIGTEERPVDHQNQINAIQIIGSAWENFADSYKEMPLATDRAARFTEATGLPATPIYVRDKTKDSTKTRLIAVHCRPGETGLEIGEQKIRCFVANKKDPIPELTLQLGNGSSCCPWASYIDETPLFQTIWHFLNTEGGKEIIREYLSKKAS